MLENEALNDSEAYTTIDMMAELRAGLFSELRRDRKIDIYRRNLQRAYVERLEFLMTSEQTPLRGAFARFSSRTNIDASQSDIRAIVRAELKDLKRTLQSNTGRMSDKISRIHLIDLVERINLILDPK